MQPTRRLSLFDSVSLIVGIIIGAGIYETAPTVAGCMGSGAATLAVWLAGGLLALAGALCYAELAAAWPRAGGDYVYLTRAYGPLTGALFGWSQLAIVRPGDIALMAFVFARYAQQLFTPGAGSGALVAWAVGLTAALTGINILGVREGRWTQNILTTAKVLGLLAVVAAALAAPSPPAAAPVPEGGAHLNLQLALILVLFTYGGWNEMAYVAAEVKRPERNIVRALAIGALAVTALYGLANAAFLRALGWGGVAASPAVAVEVIRHATGADAAGRLIAALICISAAGAVNGLIFTGARISYALGADHAMFRAVGRWSERRGTPVMALLVQGAISVAIIVAAGSFVDTIVYSAPVVWLFFTGTGQALFVLRRRDATAPRPYRVIGYPAVPALFVATGLFMLYNSVSYAWAFKPQALGLMMAVMALGVPVYYTSRWLERRRGARPARPA